MSLLKNLTTDASIANERDSLGGARLLDSGLHLFTITLAYLQVATSGALSLVLGLKAPAGETRQTFWLTGGKDKGCKNYYEDKSGAKQYLPGFILANSLALLTVGKELSELETEQKVTNVYNADAKKELPTKVDMLMDLIGKEILGGVIRQTVDKTKKDAAGVYQPTGETREENEVDKFFRASDCITTTEIRAEATEAAFATAWEEKWKGVTRNKAKGASGTAGAPKAAAKTAANDSPARKSLFG